MVDSFKNPNQFNRFSMKMHPLPMKMDPTFTGAGTPAGRFGRAANQTVDLRHQPRTPP
jgi:hypothetical protein